MSNTRNIANLPNGDDAPVYACRAFVNFNASSGTPSVGSSGNVSSITDNGVGQFRINYAISMANANYTATSSFIPDYGIPNNVNATVRVGLLKSVSEHYIDVSFGYMHSTSKGGIDYTYNSVSIFQ